MYDLSGNTPASAKDQRVYTGVRTTKNYTANGLNQAELAANNSIITTDIAILNAATGASHGIRLPQIAYVGQVVVIYNDTALALGVWPYPGQQIKQRAVSAAETIAANTFQEYTAITGSRWGFAS